MQTPPWKNLLKLSGEVNWYFSLGERVKTHGAENMAQSAVIFQIRANGG